MKFVQKLGKALMLPVACLPICGILMGLGYAMCPSTMQGGDVTGIVEQSGMKALPPPLSQIHPTLHHKTLPESHKARRRCKIDFFVRMRQNSS